MRNENIIVEGLREGNKKIFELIYETYYASLVVFAQRYLTNRAECEDCVQLLFIKLWRNRKSLHITTSLSSYLHVSVKNHCLNIISRNKLQLNDDSSLELLNTFDDFNPERLLQLKELQSYIIKIISQLPDRQQKVFQLSRFEGKKYHEIALKLGVSKKTIEADISKALYFLRNSINDY